MKNIKYKLGTLIEYSALSADGTTSDSEKTLFGTITTIILSADECFYRVNDDKREIAEDEIVGSYKAVVETRKKPATKKPKVKRESSLQDGPALDS